jgi:hypothetical protein
MALSAKLKAPVRAAAPAPAVAPETLVSSRVMAMWLGSSRAYVSELEARGVISRVKGKLPLRASVLAYIEYLRRKRDAEQTPRSESASEHHRLKAQLVAYQIARYEREHITMAEHDMFTEQIMGMFLTHASGWAARIGGTDMVLRRRCDQAVFDMRTALADEALRLAEEAEKNDSRKA